MAQLSDTKARNIKPEDKPLPHGNVVGLTLHPSKHKGKGKWVLRYVSPVTKKRRNAGLGVYPEVGVAEAGKLASLFREQLAADIDPLEEKKHQATKQQEPTFMEAAALVHAELTPSWRNEKHAQQWLNTLTTYAVPIIGHRLLSELQPVHIADVLRPIWLDKPETASRVKQRLHAVISWGWACGFCQSNPVDVVTHLLPPLPSKNIRQAHQPAMDWRAIPSFIQEHIRHHGPYEITPKLIEFVILTACRSGEARGMLWSEVDFKDEVWTIPATRMKAKQPHRVPLSKRCVALLLSQKGMHDELVFPSPRKGVVLSDMAITSYLRKRDIPSTTPGRIATAHGFRSSFRDWCSEQGYARDLAERALAHTIKNQAEAAYHRTDLLDQRRPMMEAWAEFIGAI